MTVSVAFDQGQSLSSTLGVCMCLCQSSTHQFIFFVDNYGKGEQTSTVLSVSLLYMNLSVVESMISVTFNKWNKYFLSCVLSHSHIHARTHARTHACMHARTHACTHTHTHTQTTDTCFSSDGLVGRIRKTPVSMQKRRGGFWVLTLKNSEEECQRGSSRWQIKNVERISPSVLSCM